MITVERAGFLTTVQDLGRTGFRASGVSLGGALDPHALAVANLLAGNAEDAAGLEATLGQLTLRSEDTRVIAWAGGDFDVKIAGMDFPSGHAAVIRPNEQLILTAPTNGARAWLAISGGIDVPPVLGSRSTDVRAGFGGLKGRPLQDGDQLPLGPLSPAASRIARRIGQDRIASWCAPWEWVSTAPLHPFLRIVPGTDWLAFEEATLKAHQIFTVTPASDRMGLRLKGERLARRKKDELISSPVAPGTLQVPPDGQPILLLGDCQTIGGYPKIAHVITVDLPAAAQLRPGDQVRFAEVTLAEAQVLLVERKRGFERFRVGLGLQCP